MAIPIVSEDLLDQVYANRVFELNFETPFKLKGNILSPVRFNSGRMESSPQRSRFYSYISLCIAERYHEYCDKSLRDIDAIAGVISGGISWATTLANCNGVPFLRVGDRISGDLPNKQSKVLIIDDVTTTGSAAEKAIKAMLRGDENANRAEVVAFFTIFDWNFPFANKKFEQLGVHKIHLFSFEDVINHGRKKGYISEEEYQKLLNFYEQQCK